MVFKSFTAPKHRQHGISLVIVLIFLVILSLLGVSAMQSSTLSARIARNEIDRNLAFQAAEAALRDGELDVRNQRFDRTMCNPLNPVGCRLVLTSGRKLFDSACTAGRCDFSPGVSPWEDAAVWGNAGVSVEYGTYSGAADLPLVSKQPRYLLEGIPPDNLAKGDPSYRITSVGYGARGSSQVMLQMVVVVRSQL